MKYFIAMACTLIACITIYANHKEKHNPVPDNVKKFYFFLGNWKGKASMTANGQTQSFDYLMDFKTDADGWGILYHEKGLIPGAAPYIGFGMLGFDTNDNTVHIFTVSNYGDVHDHKGSWIDDKNFALVYNGTSDGKALKEELSVQYVDATTFKFTDVVTIGGEVAQTLNAEMHKSSTK